jgi:FkbM family methyltransferase
MNFVSYAQNQEDVMLYRALREVRQGFYIDVGAQDPIVDSVTKAFYDRGWRGINIEPSSEYFQRLQSERPHDINLATAVGKDTGVITFYEVLHTGLSTTRASYAQRHSLTGHEVAAREVPCTTLDQICQEYRVSTVHFLKIDVEGSEREVLEGFSFETVRPWLVVVEATEPNTDRQLFAEWEELLINRSYRFIYFDGLNRFYVAEEHAELAEHFSHPPNVFDQYVSYQFWQLREELQELRSAERTGLISSLNHMLAEVQNLRAEAQALRESIVALNEREQTLRKTMAEREQMLQEVMAQRDRQLGSLQELMAQRDRQLGAVQANLVAAQRRLKSIRSSVSWKITSPLREVRRGMLRIVGAFRSRAPATSSVSTLANSPPTVRDEIALTLSEPARLLYQNLREAASMHSDLEQTSTPAKE